MKTHSPNSNKQKPGGSLSDNVKVYNALTLNFFIGVTTMSLYGAVIGYEGLITKNPVPVFVQERPKDAFVFSQMNPEYFQTKKLGFSNDGSYYYFVSENRREVEIFLEGIKTTFSIIKEVIN